MIVGRKDGNGSASTTLASNAALEDLHKCCPRGITPVPLGDCRAVRLWLGGPIPRPRSSRPSRNGGLSWLGNATCGPSLNYATRQYLQGREGIRSQTRSHVLEPYSVNR